MACCLASSLTGDVSDRCGGRDYMALAVCDSAGRDCPGGLGTLMGLLVDKVLHGDEAGMEPWGHLRR